MLKRLIFAILALAIVAAGFWALWPKPLSVETGTVERRGLAITIDEEGKAQVRDLYTVSAPITGELKRIGLNPGDPITTDSIVAMIRPVAPALLDVRSLKVAQAQAEAAQAAVDLSNAQERQAEMQLKFSQGELERVRKLAHNGVVSGQAFEKAELDVAVASAEVERLKANVALAVQQLESAKAALIDTSANDTATNCCIHVHAPTDGQVLRVLIQNEQVVTAGTPLLEIGDLSKLEISVDLLSRDAAQLAVGASAQIDGWGGPPLSAKVIRIDPQAQTKISALGIEEQRVTVTLRLDATPAAFKQLGNGFRVLVHISAWKADEVVVVPISALFRNGAQWAVFTVAGGKAQLKEIEIDHRNADYAEVLKGLAAGEAVVLFPDEKINDGASLSPVQLTRLAR
jgi:HlyD family secretion protein